MKKTEFKRKRQGKTNYITRRRLLSSRKYRIIVRKSNKHITIQAAEYKPEGDKILLTTTTKELEKLGWKANTKNTSASYLCGLLFGKKLSQKGINDGIADLGMYTTVKGCRLFAALKGVKDSGISIQLNEKVIPKDDKIKGKQITEWCDKAKEKNKNCFNNYAKKGLDPKKLNEHFEEIKKKITK